MWAINGHGRVNKVGYSRKRGRGGGRACDSLVWQNSNRYIYINIKYIIVLINVIFLLTISMWYMIEHCYSRDCIHLKLIGKPFRICAPDWSIQFLLLAFDFQPLHIVQCTYCICTLSFYSSRDCFSKWFCTKKWVLKLRAHLMNNIQ